MAKFKVGDRVKATVSVGNADNTKGFVGKIINIEGHLDKRNYLVEFDKNICGHACAGNGTVKGKYGHCWWVTCQEIELANPPLQSVHIYTDGVTTTAKLCEGKTVVKTATAKYNPNDEKDGMPFDFLVGADLAFNRLRGRFATSELLTDMDDGEVIRFTSVTPRNYKAENRQLIAEKQSDKRDMDAMSKKIADLTVELERLKGRQAPSAIDWEAFKSGKIAVHCDTEEKAKAFCKEVKERLSVETSTWKDGETNWDNYRKEQTYSICDGQMCYCDVKCDTAQGLKIVPYVPAVREVKRNAKVGEWVKIVDGNGCGNTKKGDIARVTREWETGDGIDYATNYGTKGSGWHCRYVVLENYSPEVQK